MRGTYSFNKLPINLINILNITKTPVNYYPNLFSNINDKFILQFNINHKKNTHDNFIKCWKSKTFSNFYFEDFNDNQNKNSIYNLQFKTDNNNIKIQRLRINNDYYNNNYDTDCYEWNNKIITKDEYKMVKTSIIDYLINLSKENNYKKIIINVHPNLERFNYELKDEGFIIENKLSDNYFFKEAIKLI
jgi:hypothetical protein